MWKLFGVVALMVSTAVSAVGMGGINVESALGQPLKATIELVAISKTEKDSLVARLASPEAYKNAGLEYPYSNKFKFQIESRADGQPYIKASSVQPVNDPFVSLLLELTWSSGKLSREYTFLLDPPGYVPEQPAQAQVQAVTPEVQAAPEVAPIAASAVPAAPEEIAATPGQATPESAVMPTEPVAPEIAQPAQQAVPENATQPGEATAETAVKPEETTPEIALKPEQTAPAIIAKPAEQAASAVVAMQENKEWLPVHRGDTMYKLAEQYKLADMSLERMLVAMYRSNADKFDARNMNRIRAGKILYVPTKQEVMSVSQSDAVKEIHAQAADWNAYRQKLASAAALSNQSQATQQATSGKINSSVADMAPVAKESAKEVLKLSKGQAPGDQVGTGAGGKSLSGQDKKNAAREEEISRNKALKEEQERTALLEKNLKDMQRLAQLKAEVAALAQPAAVPKSAVTAAVSAVKPAPVVVTPKPKQVKPEPALLDQILGEPLYLVGGAVVLLILGGVIFMLLRRRKKNSIGGANEFIEDPGSATGRITAPVVPSPDTGDFTFSAAPQALATSQAEHVDPISEADLFLNFGRDVQAEEILTEALQHTPNNHQIHLKLLGIYANRKDTNSFASIARQLQSSGDEQAWQQAIAMGRKLEPNNPLYGGGGGTIEEASSATRQMTAFDVTQEPKNIPQAKPSALDFDFDVGATATHSPEQDFLGSAEKSMSADGKLATPAAEMDFDVTSTNPSMHAAGGPAEAASPSLDELAFDVTSSNTFTPPAAQPQASKPAAPESGAMEFTLDFPVENIAQKSASMQVAEVDLSGISLNFDEAAAPRGAAAESKNDQWQEVATKLDLARAYQEMGDGSGAREILEEVMREGDAEQRAAAQAIFEQLG
ncbi:MAG: FimV/HubP family polar landmark protein [Gallionella sp.]